MVASPSTAWRLACTSCTASHNLAQQRGFSITTFKCLRIIISAHTSLYNYPHTRTNGPSTPFAGIFRWHSSFPKTDGLSSFPRAATLNVAQSGGKGVQMRKLFGCPREMCLCICHISNGVSEHSQCAQQCHCNTRVFLKTIVKRVFFTFSGCACRGVQMVGNPLMGWCRASSPLSAEQLEQWEPCGVSAAVKICIT